MTNQAQELERAIMMRAERLAAEYRQRAEHSRDNILREAHDRLHLREEREVLLAKSKAEKAYRRLVQASDLKLQKEIDHLRWDLVQAVQQQLTDRMNKLREKRDDYRELLIQLIASAAQQLDADKLLARVNAADLHWLQQEWPAIVQAAAPDKQIKLDTLSIDTLGGVMLFNEDATVRVNNTFEGRRERLEGRLHQLILERLLPNANTHVADSSLS